MSIEEKSSIYSDLNTFRKELTLQETVYNNEVASINAINKAAMLVTAKTNYTNYLTAAINGLNTTKTNHAGKFTDEEAEVDQLIADYQEKLDALK